MGLFLLTGRCYEAEICAILLLLRCSFRWYPFLPKSKFSDSGRKPWTIVRCFDRKLSSFFRVLLLHVSKTVYTLFHHSLFCTLSAVAVVVMGFEQPSYAVDEEAGSVTVCATAVDIGERDITLNLTTAPGTAGGKGKYTIAANSVCSCTSTCTCT